MASEWTISGRSSRSGSTNQRINHNGLENLFLSIAKDVDGEIPTGSQWHRDLLARMTMPTAQRAAVLTGETAHRLDDYLGFRHFYRHSYSFKVEWGQLEKLATPLTEVWADVKEELQLFLEGAVNRELLSFKEHL